MKVGSDIDEDIRRASIIREEIGPEAKLMMDANQKWDVTQAISNMKQLARFNPWWIEEPTSPDDVLGHAAIARAIAPIKVATGEHCQNRVVFKQLLQAKAISFCQIDSCRLGGVNEILAVLLILPLTKPFRAASNIGNRSRRVFFTRARRASGKASGWNPCPKCASNR